MWWDHLCALVKALRTRGVRDRIVAAKWKTVPMTPWRAVRPHLLLALAAVGAFAWTWLRTDRSETVWGTLLFLGLIAVSQSFIIFKVTRVPKNLSPIRQEIREARPLAMPAVYSQQPREL